MKHDHVRHMLFHLLFSPRMCNRHLSTPNTVLHITLCHEQILMHLHVHLT